MSARRRRSETYRGLWTRLLKAFEFRQCAGALTERDSRVRETDKPQFATECRTMEINQLRYLVAVAEEGSYGWARRVLFVFGSSPVMSF